MKQITKAKIAILIIALVFLIFPAAASPESTGGNITYYGGYTIHTFNSNGTFTAGSNLNAEILVVGGGGAGGSTIGGGGGAGGLIYNTSFSITSGSVFAVVVGQGGTPGTASDGTAAANGGNGSNSNFSNLIAIGGGGGGNMNGGNGGSGGGSGRAPSYIPGSGTSGQGYRGGYSLIIADQVSGGGGGNNSVGTNATGTNGGNGGNGKYINFNGTSICYAGGGGGGARSGYTAGSGNTTCGGGNGYNANGVSPTGNGIANTGGGGGGAGYASAFGAGGSGGSGIVIVKYLSHTTNGNNYTNDDTLNFTISNNDYINFNVTNVSYNADMFSWFLNGVNQSINFNNVTLYISTSGENNITAVIHNSTSGNVVVTWFVTLPFTLLTPANGSTINEIYPPLDTPVNFSWSSVGYPYYELVISRTASFSLIVSDTYTTETSKNVSLIAGNYWWKVRSYDSTTGIWGDYSDVFNFTLSLSSAAAGSGVDGVVYEIIGGIYTPIDQATVYVYNTTWSSYMLTGSNGYYLFSDLSNGTYNIYASKVLYDTTVVLPVTVNGSIVTNDILMKQTEPTDFESNQQYVMFRTRWLWCITDCDIEGLTVSIYESGEPITYKSGTTDSLGIFKAKLFKSQLYRVTFINSSLGVNQEGNYYGSNPEYLVFITNTGSTFQEHETQEKDAINIVVSKSIYNGTMANISINYTDSLSQTTALTYYINQSNPNDPVNQTNIASWTWAAGSYNHTFNVFNYSGQSYLVHIKATHTTYGTIDRTYAVVFEKTSGVGITGISNTLWLWFAIGIMFFTGAIFTSSTAEKGLLIVCAEGWIFFFMGMFASLGTFQFGIGLTLASVIAVLAYFKKSNVSEGYT